ncbi:recombinase family protein [Paraburkholderia sp. SOS3]|uniref:recombinase family protein n=1 Tax=Paraburkholderia sp. SOS3 TaxID=1926494 RepID=UPI0009473D1A|nr:recombinase family protein [Paraburkholderia sp. SOS3]APR36718.1 resolvase [Paraburkholderia sp. SOS3]
MRIGYARVSTQEQETRAQLDALTKAGVELVHEEKRSGATLRRPVLDKLLRNLKRGDTLVVYKLDRIARSLKHLLSIIERLQDRGADFESLTEHIDTNTPAGRLMLQMLGAFAEFEREMIRERTRSGMQAAKGRGIRLGRPRSLQPEEERQAVAQWRTGRYTLTALAHQYGVHLSSIKRAVYRADQAVQPRLLND